MKKLFLALITVSSLAFFSCGNKEKVLKMGTNAAFPPFEWIEGKDVVGFDVTLSNLIANDYGQRLKVVDMSFDGLIAALQAGSVDFIASGMTATDERRKSVDFSDPYYSSKQTILVRVSNKSVNSVSDLKGMTIGVQAATTGEIYATEEIEGANVKSFRTVIDASLALKNTAIDAIIIDELPAKEIVKSNPELKIVDDDFFTDEYAIAVKKGNKDLLNSINNTIRTIKANGIYQKMLEAYMPLDGDVKIVSPDEL